MATIHYDGDPEGTDLFTVYRDDTPFCYCTDLMNARIVAEYLRDLTSSYGNPPKPVVIKNAEGDYVPY